MPVNELPATILEDNKGKPVLPSERFNNAREVKEYAGAMISADNTRSDWRKDIDGLINGNPPIPPGALEAKKMKWYPNANFREAEGYIQAPQTAFYDLVTEANPCIEIYLDYGKGEDKVNWEERIAKHWTWLMLSKWRLGFNYHVPMCQREMLVHGLGCHVWPQMNVANWIERTPRSGHILFPEDSPVNFDEEGEAFMLRDFVPLHRLYGFIKNEKAAATLGWQPDIVWKTMAMVSKNQKNGKSNGNNIEAYVRQMKRGDQGGSIARQSGVWINWVFVRELDSSKVSLYAVPEGVDPGGYLFKKRNVYDSWPLAMFPYDIGNGTLHSIRGLGARSKAFFELSNRIKNTMAAQVILGSTVLLQQTGTLDPVKTKLLKMGMMSILPQNLQIAQGVRFPDLSQGPLALDAKLHDTLRDNTQTYAGGSPDPMDRETAASYMMRSQDSAKVSKGAHGLYGSHLCNYWNIKLRMVLRAAKMSGEKPYITMAKEFVKRCERDGVPAEAFDHIGEVREVMSTGAGSAATRLQAMFHIMQYVFPNTTDDRRVNILRDLTAFAMDGAKVDRYAPSLNDHDMTNDDDSIIALENDALSRGGKAVVTPHQNQVRHAQGHLQSAGMSVQAVQQGQMPPEEGLQSIRAHGTHIAAHLQKIQENPTKKDDYQSLQKELQALGGVADQLQQHVQEAQDAAQQPSPQQQASDQLQIGLAKVQSNHEIKAQKLQSDLGLKFRKQAFEEKIADARTAAEIHRQNAKQLSLTR